MIYNTAIVYNACRVSLVKTWPYFLIRLVEPCSIQTVFVSRPIYLGCMLLLLWAMFFSVSLHIFSYHPRGVA